MASSNRTHPGIPHHIPGVQLTYGHFNSDTTPYQPYARPNAPKEPTHHQLSTSQFSPQTYPQQDSFTTKIVKDLQEKLINLQAVDASRAEVITEQKVEIAVLKNELKHARHDKEAVISSFGIVIESITRGACVTPSPQVLASASTSQTSNSENKITALEKEIERYRKSDRLLRSRIQGLERGNEIRGRERERENGADSAERDCGLLRKGDGWMLEARGRLLDKGMGKMVERELGPNSDSANLPHCQQEDRHNTGSGPTTSQLNKMVRSWGEDFVEDLNGNSNYNLSDELPTTANSPVAEPVHPAYVDVGMCSLEYFLNNDGIPPSFSAQSSSIPSTMVLEFPPTITAQSSSLSATPQGPKLEEDERDIDQQIEENKKVMALLAKMPTPGVIKTGFTLEGSFRGADYDKMKPSHPARDFDRFAPNFRNSNRETRTGHGTSFETPKDRSFDQGLWNDSQDRNGALEGHMRAATGRNDTRFPDIFRYGIQYVPADGDSNYLRTVHLSNLPLDTEVRDVLARVRGGDIVSATVVKMGKITPGTTQARVVFKHEAAAEKYVLYAASHPISFTETIAQITLVETPTYPLPAKQVSRLREQTRCIAIPNIPSYFSLGQLEHDLACRNVHRAESLIEMFIDEEYTLHLQFANVDMAGSAWGILNAWSAYRGLLCRWEADPCAGEVEELALQIVPRPKMLPDNWSQRRDGERSGGEGVQGVGSEGRKPLAALGGQKVNIPDFSAAKLKAKSWADEVNGVDDDEDDEKMEIMDEAIISLATLDDKPDSDSDVLVSAVGPAGVKSSESSESSKKASVERNLEAELTAAPVTSNLPTTSDQMEILPLKVLTVDQELRAALLASNTNQHFTNIISSTPPSHLDEPRRSTIGLSGSKYSSSTPAFVDTGKPPHSIDINKFSSSSFFSSNPEHPAHDYSAVLPPAKYHLSASPPRVDLYGLIKSGRSSYASAGSGEPSAQSSSPSEVDSGNISPLDGHEIAKPNPQPQLFKWSNIPSKNRQSVLELGSTSGSGTTYGAREEAIDERSPRVPVEVQELEVRPTASHAIHGTIEQSKVINPEKIDIDLSDDEQLVNGDEQAEDAIAGFGANAHTETVSASKFVTKPSVKIVADVLGEEVNPEDNGEPLEVAIHRANEFFGNPAAATATA